MPERKRCILKIGSMEIQGKAVLAPMAGVTDRPFRRLCRQFGAAYCVTEMVSAKALQFKDKKTPLLMRLDENEHPAAIQIFGDEPEVMALAAQKAMEFSPDAIDINMGCPAPKIANNGSGSALMKNPDLCGRIVEAVSRAVEVPVTVKIRKGWDENSVIAEMKVNENFVGNHQHLDAGSFQIYYRGPLAIDSGTYQGSSGGYNSPHNKNYFKRTIAHNSLLVYDPDEKFECWNYGGGDKTEYAANDGGQRMPGDRWDTCRSFEDLLGESYTVGKALAHDFGPDRNVPEYSYLKGDITDAYSDKVREVKRSFVFINLNDTADSSARIPATLIVFDKVVSSDPGFRKYWLLHSIEEPVIENNTFTVDRTLNGDSGRLHDTVLLPEPGNAEISKIGGPGKDFYVFGTNYPNEPRRKDPANEKGAWRIEICPAAPSEEDIFLNVIQITDNSNDNVYPAAMIDARHIAGGRTDMAMTCSGTSLYTGSGEWTCGSPATGVMIADRAVFFSRDSSPIGCSFSIDIPDPDYGQVPVRKEGRDGCCRILMTDLLPGTWQVLLDGNMLRIILRTERPVYRPIVRHGDLLPLAVIK